MPVFLIGCLPCESAKNLSSRAKQAVFFSGFFSFLIESYLIFCVAAFINQTNPSMIFEISARAFGVNVNILFAALFTLIVIAIPIAVAMLYTEYFEVLTQDSQAKQKYGKFIEDLNTLRNGKTVILFPVIGLVRKLFLAFTVVHLQNYPNFSIFSINLQTLAMIMLIGHTEPYKLKSQNRLEMFNEFSLLLVNYHQFSLTDWVSDADTR